METLKYIKNKYGLDYDGEMPIKLPFDRLNGLTVLWRKLGFKIGAEIGVRNGYYSKWICIKNKNVKLFLIDPYKAYPEYVERHDKDGQIKLDKSYEKAKSRLEKFNCEFIKKMSMDAVNDFLDNSLDFVFIDGNHTFEYVVNDIAEWSKKVKPGGIVSGHDYYRSTDMDSKKLWGGVSTDEQILKLCQVKDAVDGWTHANNIKPWFITSCNSWFYVK